MRQIPPQWESLVLWSGSLFFLNPHMPMMTPSRPSTMVTSASEQMMTPKAYLRPRHVIHMQRRNINKCKPVNIVVLDLLKSSVDDTLSEESDIQLKVAESVEERAFTRLL